MLRASNNTAGSGFNLGAIRGHGSSGVAQEATLLALAESVLSGDKVGQDAARRQLRQTLGDAAFVDTCAIIASFNAVVKLADASGILLEDDKAKNTQDIRAELSIDDFQN